MFRHVELWQQGNLTQREYSKTVGIPCSKFKYWRKRYIEQSIAKTKDRSEPSMFVPLKTAIKKLPELTLQYPNGVQLHCPSDIDLQVLEQFIKISAPCLP